MSRGGAIGWLKSSPLRIAAPLALLSLVALLGWATVSSSSHPPVQMANEKAQPAPPEEQPTAVAAALAAPSAAPEPKPSAGEPDAQPARLAEVPTLELAAQSFPRNTNLLFALASAQAGAGHFEDALGTLDRALVIDPESAQNRTVTAVLWASAQSSASEQAFRSLQKLGNHGGDVLFDLAVAPGVPKAIRTRAKQELTVDSVKSNLSPDTAMAARFLNADDCRHRLRLLNAAKMRGGSRTLQLLEAYRKGKGCEDDADAACSACMRHKAGLGIAIAMIRARTYP